MPRTKAVNQMTMMAHAGPFVGKKGLPMARNKHAYVASASSTRLTAL